MTPLLSASAGTRNVELVVDGQIFMTWTRVNITRSLTDLSGSFELEMTDPPRHIAAFPWSTPRPGAPIRFGAKAEIRVWGEPVLVGWIEDVHPYVEDGRAMLYVAGRDVTCDPVDCPPDPRGRHEYRNIDLLEFCKKVLAKWPHISVRAEVDVGAAFDRLSVDAGETALSAIEKHARKRGVLVTSDGVGGVVLTRSGKTAAPGSIALPGNVRALQGNVSARERFSDYFVKGGAEKSGGRKGGPALDAEAGPADEPRQAAGDQSGEGHAEAAGSLVMGHARDEEVTRWRPVVNLSRTQTSQNDAQTYAEWLMRTRRGKSEQVDYEVSGWRAPGGLWRLNQLAMVEDNYSLISRQMLIHRIAYQYSARGELTRLGLCGPEAYDREPAGDRRQAKGGARSAFKGA